jgi:hypothetical protein
MCLLRECRQTFPNTPIGSITFYPTFGSITTAQILYHLYVNYVLNKIHGELDSVSMRQGNYECCTVQRSYRMDV